MPKCQTCGKDFLPEHTGRKCFCSRECWEASLLVVEEVPRERKKRAKKIVASIVRKPDVAKICPVCGKEFKTSYSKKIYCSQECYASANVERMRSRTVHKKPTLISCPVCGKEFEKKGKAKFCSHDCCRIAQKDRNIRLEDLLPPMRTLSGKELASYAVLGYIHEEAEKFLEERKYMHELRKPEV